MSSIPFVIDNQQHRMGDVLTTLLAEYQGQSLDIATAYFNIGGWRVLSDGLAGMGNFRLLLGDEPEVGVDVGLREIGSRPVKGLIKDLAGASFDEQTLRTVEDLTAFLQQDHVQVRLYTKGFLHAKCYLFYQGGGFDHLNPVAAIVGSSNFTRSGLISNKELNLVHRANLGLDDISNERLRGKLETTDRNRLKNMAEADRVLGANLPGVLAINELANWFDQQWEHARDFKEELLDLLDASKFGRKAYTPYQVYMKAIYEYFREDIEEDAENSGKGRSAVELSEFQDDAVKKARRLLARYDGVVIADSVGLGKTWIGKKLLEDYAYHQRYRAVVICPAALQPMWDKELKHASISAHIVTQEMLGRENFDPHDLLDADIFLIDESHNFRNKNAGRYLALEHILASNNRRGGLSEQRKKVILLTATPINNSVFDLYNQINLLTGGDNSYFAAAGIGDLKRYFNAARREIRQQESGIALFNVLEEIVIRRTRPFIKEAYPNATIQGHPIHWPERKLKTIHYNLETSYKGIYDQVVSRIEGLTLAPYHLEAYKKKGIERDQFEEGREEALVGIFKSRYLKRFESSIEAFRISVRRALEFLETFQSVAQAGKLLNSADYRRAMNFLASEDEEDDATPASPAATLTEDLDGNAEARVFLASLPTLDIASYDMQRLRTDIQRDIEALHAVFQAIDTITPLNDAKLATLKQLLATDLKGQKVLLFTYYKDTARYLYRHLTGPTAEAVSWRAEAGEPGIKHMDSGNGAKERTRLVAEFAPRANQREDLIGSSQEIDIMISTDVLSEGQNLQDCGILINYDLHWNPTRMVQRAGRIDRIGTSFHTLHIMNMFPDAGLEALLGLVESLSQKIAHIDRNGLLDASILGEVVHPQNFNTLRRIEAEDGTVVEEQEQFSELASSEYLLQNLKNLMGTDLRETLESLPDGIHSGLANQSARGVFFYFTAQDKAAHGITSVNIPKTRRHFWRYIDLSENPQGGRIESNRYIITSLIQCHPDTLRVVPPEGTINIFALQEKVVADILQASIEQVAKTEAPKVLDPMQQVVKTTIQTYIHSPTVSRKEALTAIQRLGTPQPGVYLKELRKAYDQFRRDGLMNPLIATVNQLGGPANGKSNQSNAQPRQGVIKREDLKLVCFDYVWH